MAERVGNQSMVVVMDVKKETFSSKYEIYIHNGIKRTRVNPVEFASEMEKLGAGEIVINSIDQDGMMKGYDLSLIQNIRDVISIPLTVLGGAGTLEDIGHIIQKNGIIGIDAGSLFVFKGKYRAVLINYPTPKDKDLLLNKYFVSHWNK